MESRREANRTTNISDVLSTGPWVYAPFSPPEKQTLVIG